MSRKKYRMGSVAHEEATLTCALGHEWPPLEAVAYGPSLEAREKVTPHVYERIKVWERVCGLYEMDLDKCPSCPHRVVDGVPVSSPGGSGPTPKMYSLKRRRR
jgi:hypothetical protein